MKGREGIGFLSTYFEKMKCIFSITSEESLDKSPEYVSLRNTHRTLAVEAPNAALMRPVCYQCLALLGLGTGRGLNPVGATGVG